jgi:hypothetical protein
MRKMKKIYFLMAVIICILLLASCNGVTKSPTSKDETEKISSTSKTDNTKIKVGDYVQFGSYLEEPILWRVMESTDGKPLLWSEFILTAKCFDASESGTASVGEDNVKKYGSNVWSNSNIREWLNASGAIDWSTQPPTAKAMWGNNAFDKEPGFLTGFSSEERGLITLTTRKILNASDEVMETTQDMVFLASYEEVRNSGKWGLNQKSREKLPTEKAMQNNKNDYPDIRLARMYYLQTHGVGTTSWQIYGVFDDGRFFSGDPNDSYTGIAPALHLSSALPKSGAGTKDNPWKF